MKLFFDTNLSTKLVKRLEKVYPDSTHAEFENLDEESDLVIWNFCKENSFTIVTKDKDYFDLSSIYGSPPKVILIRSGNCPTETIEKLLLDNIENITLMHQADKILCLFLH